MTARVGWRDHLIGALLCATYVALLLVGARDLAMSRDESFYVVAAQDYAGWFELVAEDSDAAMQPEAIAEAWDYNHEHPALAKALFGLSWLAHQKWELFPDESTAFRFPGMLSAGLLLWLLYIFGARVFGRQAGVMAAATYALLPRAFYHAHLNCFDVPITLALTFVVYCYWRSLRQPRWAVMTGVAYGLALATKHNAWILPGILLIHFVWLTFARWKERRSNPEVVVPPPWWLLACVTIGPLLFLGSWPWLWDETLPRLGWYVRFHFNHEYYNMAYFGRNYFEPPFPVSFPFVMTLFTVPLVTLVLAGLGIAQRARAMLPGWLARRIWPDGQVKPDRVFTDVLFAGCLLAPVLVIALPSTPIFGGTKHWFPAYPFLCLYAGFGFWRVAHTFRHGVGSVFPYPRVTARLTAAAIVLAPATMATEHAHPFGLSHYTFAAGGVPGAADHGMNRQFWGFTTGSVADWLAEHLPDGGSVYLCDTTHWAWQMLHRDERLPRNVRATASLTAADYVLVHHEHHFAEVDYQAWVAFGSTKPAHVLTLDGVPIVSIYENPRRRR